MSTRRLNVTDVRAAIGDRFRARAPGGHRTVVLERVHIEEGCVPRVEAREVVTCGHATLRALAGGVCPVCPVTTRFDRDLFAIVLTARDGAWFLPAWYEALA